MSGFDKEFVGTRKDNIYKRVDSIDRILTDIDRLVDTLNHRKKNIETDQNWLAKKESQLQGIKDEFLQLQEEVVKLSN